MTRCHVAAILAAAFTFLLGVALARREERVPAWSEPEDGVQPADPYTWTLV